MPVYFSDGSVISHSFDYMYFKYFQVKAFYFPLSLLPPRLIRLSYYKPIVPYKLKEIK